jgi:hypothetical protein
MPAVDNFLVYNTDLSAPVNRQWLIVPDDADELPFVTRTIYCRVAGDIRFRDKQGETLTYTCVAGEKLPHRAVQVYETGTTGTFYGWE